MRSLSPLITLADLLAFRAHDTPSALALLETRPTARQLTYRAYAERVWAIAHAWRPYLPPGARLLIWLDKRIEVALASLAANALGALFTIVNPALKPQQVNHLVRDAAPTLLLTSRARATLLPALSLTSSSASPIPIADFTHPLLAPFLSPPDDPDPLLLLHYTSSSSDPLLTGGLSSPPRLYPTDRDPAALFYTSGSTGPPKGVVVPHRALVAGAESVVSYLGLTPQDRIAALLPFAFDAGFSQLTSAMAAGASLLLHDYLTPRSALAAMAEGGVTVLVAVPPLWRQLLNNDPWPASFAASLTIAASTGGVMPPAWVRAILQRAPRVRFTIMYGLTEAFRATYLPPDDWPQRPTSIGIPIPHAELLILDERGTPLPPYQPGEIVQRGPLLALGYWNDPERTQQRFRPLPSLASSTGAALPPETVLFTGDYGYRDEAGYYYYLGRRDEQIKTSGYRVSPEEIETVLQTHPAILECCVCGLPDEERGEIIAVWAVITHETTPEELLAHCRAQLATYQIPRTIHCTTQLLPRTLNGKIDRAAVRAHLRALSSAPTS
ncbi:MAG: AMP-binding protein [Hydrogenophilus sp.]|nr:AMP-binding protein [Hydrogenophilus sp.]